MLVALTAVSQAAEGDKAKTGEPRPQIDVPRIDEMPARPTPFTVIDWNKLARDYADLAFDLETKGMQLGSCYPDEQVLDEPLRITADQFVRAADILLSTPEKFAWSTFDFRLMKPVRNIVPVQRDAAGGFAALLYWAYQRFGDRKYLEASLRCLTARSMHGNFPVNSKRDHSHCQVPSGRRSGR